MLWREIRYQASLCLQRAVRSGLWLVECPARSPRCWVYEEPPWLLITTGTSLKPQLPTRDSLITKLLTKMETQVIGVPLTSSKVAYQDEYPPVRRSPRVARTGSFYTQAFYASFSQYCSGLLLCEGRRYMALCLIYFKLMCCAFRWMSAQWYWRFRRPE